MLADKATAKRQICQSTISLASLAQVKRGVLRGDQSSLVLKNHDCSCVTVKELTTAQIKKSVQIFARVTLISWSFAVSPFKTVGEQVKKTIWLVNLVRWVSHIKDDDHIIIIIKTREWRKGSNGTIISKKEQKPICSHTIAESIRESSYVIRSWNGQKRSLHSWRSLTVKSSSHSSQQPPHQETSLRKMLCSKVSTSWKRSKDRPTIRKESDVSSIRRVIETQDGFAAQADHVTCCVERREIKGCP